MFWEKFLTLCEQHNIRPNPLAKKLGISSGAVTEWKKGRVPRHDILVKIANYFGVSVDYLLGKTDEPAPATEKKTAPAFPLTDAEKTIFISYRSNAAFKEAVDNILRLMPKEDRKTILGAGTLPVFRAARSSDDHDAEIVEMDAARLAALDALPDTDEL